MSVRLQRLMMVFALLGFIGGIYLWLTAGYESTDDAFVERDLTYLRPRVAGTLQQLLVADYQAVKAGDVLAELDPQPFQIALAQAQAQIGLKEAELARAAAELARFSQSLIARKEDATRQIAVARAQVELRQRQLARIDAQLEQAERDVKRYGQLIKQRQISQQTFDDSRTQLTSLHADRGAALAEIHVAQEQVGAALANQAVVAADADQVKALQAGVESARQAVAQAVAQRDQAQLELNWTHLRAPADGWISRIEAKSGSQVGTQTTVAIFISGDAWVTANFKETQLRQMQVGSEATLHLDAYPDVMLHGHVQAFQPGTGARFSLLPPENATGNFVKVVQRVPVKILLDQVPAGLLLVPGMSVEASVRLGAVEATKATPQP